MKTVLGKVNMVIKKGKYFPFLVLFFVWLAYFLLSYHGDYRDDAVFLENFTNAGSVLEHIKFMRNNWSGRTVIEAVYFYLLWLPRIVWRVLNSGIIALLAYSVARVTGVIQSRKLNWLVCASIFLYPMTDMATTGWVSSSNNYIWPLALGLYAMIPWKDQLAGKKPAVHTMLLSLPALAYAASAEMMLAICAAACLLACCTMLWRRVRFAPYNAIWIVVLVAAGIFYITTPGNAQRVSTEVGAYYPDFYAVSPIEKIYQIYMMMNNHFWGAGQLTTLFAAVLVFATVWVKRTDVLYRTVAGVPAAMTLLFGPLYPLVIEVAPALEGFGRVTVTSMESTSLSAYVPFVVYSLVWACLFAGLFLAADGWMEAGALWAVTLAGICAIIALTFAPSMFLSFQRVGIYLHFSFIILGCFLLGRIKHRYMQKWVGTSVFVLLLSAMGALNMLMSSF